MHSAEIIRAVVLFMDYHRMTEKLKAAHVYINNDITNLTR